MNRPTDDEINLRQALVAVLCAARDLGFDVGAIAEKAAMGILGSQRYRTAEHPHVMGSKEEIDRALTEMKEMPVDR